MKNEIIAKLLKSKCVDDNLLALEYQYQAFKHGYTNWYKRDKYNREFRKRIALILGIDSDVSRYDSDINVPTLKTTVYQWFKERIEEDFNNKML